MSESGVVRLFVVAVGLSYFCYPSQTEIANSHGLQSPSMPSLASASQSPSMNVSAHTFSTNGDSVHSKFSWKKTKLNSPQEFSQSSSDTNSDSSRDQSAPGDDEKNPLLTQPSSEMCSDSSRDQSIPGDDELWSPGMRQRVQN